MELPTLISVYGCILAIMGMTADERLGMGIKRAEQTLMAAKSSALKDVGSTVARYVVLFTLAGDPGISGTTQTVPIERRLAEEFTPRERDTP